MNFLKQTDNYDTKKFLIVIFSIQIALIGSIALDFLNLPIPILRQVIGFAYLTFVPGIVIHRAFKLQKLNNLESFTCIIGLSILFLMFTGFFMNILYHFYELKPISVIPLIITICITVSVLSLLCYIRDKDTSTEVYLSDKKHSLSLPLLLLCIIPFLGIFGGYLLNYYQTNVLMVVNIIFISILLLLVIFTDLFPKHLYPLAIFVISISLLYQNSLSSTYLDGWDIQYEYHFANLVVTNSLWNSAIPNNVNAMLSIVMLAPIYSIICNLELTYVFKIIYPFIYSMIPIALYYIYQKQIKNEKVAFLSVFYFISIYTFSTEMLALARQQIAELFLVLIFLVLLSDLELLKKKLLICLFMLGLVTSHYGLSYLMLIIILAAYLFMKYILKDKSNIFTINYMFLFLVVVLTWYIYLTDGSLLQKIILIFVQIFKEITTDIFATSTVNLVTNQSASFSGQILKIQYLISQFFIMIGFIKVLIKSKDFQISNEYLSFSFLFICVLISSLITSYTGMNIHRLYHITSILLSPFCVIGGVFIFQSMYNIFRTGSSIKSFKISLNIIAVFFVMFLFFNVGLGQQLLNDTPTSIYLNREYMKNSDNIETNYNLYETHFPSQDVISTRWLSKNRNLQTKIYGDYTSSNLLFFSYGMMSGETLSNTTMEFEPGSYFYLRYPNIHYKLISGRQFNSLDLNNAFPVLDQKNLIYSNQDSYIYQF